MSSAHLKTQESYTGSVPLAAKAASSFSSDSLTIPDRLRAMVHSAAAAAAESSSPAFLAGGSSRLVFGQLIHCVEESTALLFGSGSSFTSGLLGFHVTSQPCLLCHETFFHRS